MYSLDEHNILVCNLALAITNNSNSAFGVLLSILLVTIHQYFYAATNTMHETNECHNIMSPITFSCRFLISFFSDEISNFSCLSCETNSRMLGFTLFSKSITVLQKTFDYNRQSAKRITLDI